jgi:hypothetical protein
MTNIDKLGEEVAARIKSAETDRASIAPDLRKIWAALDAKQSVNGCSSKKAWADKFGVTMRYCQYLVRDGSRQRKKEANPVRVLDGVKVGLRDYHADAGEGWVSVEFEKARIETYKGKMNEPRENGDWSYTPADKNGILDWQHKIVEIGGNVRFTIEDGTFTQEQIVAGLLKKMREGLKIMHLWDDKLVAEFEEYAKEDAEYQAERKESRSQSAKKAAQTRKARQVVQPTGVKKSRKSLCEKCGKRKPRKATLCDACKNPQLAEQADYMKKFRAAKRAAKFFGGMYMEFANGVNRDYKRFLELYRPDGDDRKYPWTPPQKGYSLPKTEKEFLAQNDAASEEFNKLLDEGIAKGVLTTAPRETQHPAAKALAATVDGADVPQVCDESSDAAYPRRAAARGD